MSVFPTKILLATDGSEEAELATTTAADLAKSTDSELDVIYVLEVEPWHYPSREHVKHPERYEDPKEESRRIRDRRTREAWAPARCPPRSSARRYRPNREAGPVPTRRGGRVPT